MTPLKEVIALLCKNDQAVEKATTKQQQNQQAAKKTSDKKPMPKSLIGVGLVIRRKKPGAPDHGVKYRVKSVNGDLITITSPEGKESTVNVKSVHDEFVID